MLGGKDRLVDWRHAGGITTCFAQAENSLQLARQGGRDVTTYNKREVEIQDVYKIGIRSVVAHLDGIADDASRCAGHYTYEIWLREASIKLERTIPHAQSLIV